MFDHETLRPVIIAMTIYITLSVVIPHIAKKSTNVKVIDDIIAFLIAQKGNIASGAILVGLATFGANYIDQEFF